MNMNPSVSSPMFGHELEVGDFANDTGQDFMGDVDMGTTIPVDPHVRDILCECIRDVWNGDLRSSYKTSFLRATLEKTEVDGSDMSVTLKIQFAGDEDYNCMDGGVLDITVQGADQMRLMTLPEPLPFVCIDDPVDLVPDDESIEDISTQTW